MRAGFLRGVKKTLCKNSPEMMHFQAWKNEFLTKGQTKSKRFFQADVSSK